MVRLWKNNRGSAMVASMIAAGLVVGASTVAFRNYNVNHDSVRKARLRNLMNVVELQVRRRALQPEGYTGCNSIGGTTGASTCSIDQNFYRSINEQNVLGAQAPINTPCRTCGFRVSFPQPVMDQSRRFRALISYSGEEVQIKPIEIDLVVPTEILQSATFNCGANFPRRPFFGGFNAQGAPICLGFTPEECPAGTFLSSIDVSRRTIACAPLPPAVTCNSDEKFLTFNWNGGNVNYTCSALQTPPFTSSRTTRSPTRTVATTATATNVVTTGNNLIPVTITVLETRTETATSIPNSPEPPPPPTPTCTMRNVSSGPGGGATPRYWGSYACTASCVGVYGAQSSCGGACYPGYRGWYYCSDCREDRVVCE